MPFSIHNPIKMEFYLIRRNIKIIDKINGTYKIICNVCGEIFSQNFEDFYEAVDFKKKERWVSRPISGGKWEEVCRDCLDFQSGKKSY